jgi:lipoate-protein ligase B
MAEMRQVEVRRLGQVEYATAQQLMRELQNQRLNGDIGDTLLICSHPEIVTIGPGARRDGTVVPSDYPTIDVDRGGGITWHGPGQLVVYPIFRWDLDEEENVKKIISKLEQWTISALELLGIQANTDSRMQGVWVDNSKIGSVGLAFMRWVSRHGFTVNFSTPKGRVETLDGCGLSAGTTTSLDRLGYETTGDELVQALLDTMPMIIGRNDAKS